MKKFKTIFIGLSVISIICCQKEPFANFTTDKEIYTAGETIHCTDASDDAYSWKWTTPDGQIVTTQNLDYNIDSDDIGGNKKITLEVASKRGKKTASCSKILSVKELILPTDYFSAGTIYKPTTKSARPGSGIYWVINAGDGTGPDCFNNLLIIFSGTTPPLAGTYTLQSDYTTVTSGTAYIQIGAPTGIECAGVLTYVSNSGQLVVSYTNNGKVHIVFNNVPTNTVNISGDITCH